MTDLAMIRNLGLILVAGCGLAALPGCGGSPQARAYAPSAASARETLDTALAAWKQGRKPATLAQAEPPVHVVDTQWESGQALESYEILAEQPGAGDAELRFSVRLKGKKPLGEKTVQYILMGREPTWVFRDDDYARTSDMADNPRPKRPGRRR